MIGMVGSVGMVVGIGLVNILFSVMICILLICLSMLLWMCVFMISSVGVVLFRMFSNCWCG